MFEPTLEKPELLPPPPIRFEGLVRLDTDGTRNALRGMDGVRSTGRG